MTHITIERAKLEQWLEKLQDVSEKVDYYGNDLMVGDEINAIKAALAQDEASSSRAAQRPWVGLTDEEAQWLFNNCRSPSNLIDMVEDKLRSKNT